MNQAEALKRLDEIERRDPDPTFDRDGVGKIMETLGATPEGLRLLVDRYAASPSANIVAQLALLLSLKSGHCTVETAPVVFEFASKLQRSDLESVLMSTLNAMKNQIGFGPGWGESPDAPKVLFPFLANCLTFKGRLDDLVHYAAVELVTSICWCGTLETTFTKDQFEWIRQRVVELSDTDNELLRDEIKQFNECLSEKVIETNKPQ